MDASSPLPRPCDGAAVPAPPGEIILHNGRLSGTRRSLNRPATVIGRAEGCDIRLNADGVCPVHCLLIAGPEGIFLQTLPGSSGTRINGELRTDGPLADGDLLMVGPFQFRLSLPESLGPSTTSLNQAAWQREQEALRIQAAAVVAQQTALTEEEARLRERQITLERQETQLAAHLEEQRRHLVELQGQIHEARKALREERTAHERESWRRRTP